MLHTQSVIGFKLHLMKRMLFVGLVVFFTTAHLRAQVFTFGPKAGLNFSRFNILESADEAVVISELPNGRKIGVTAGAFLQLNLGPFVLQPEVMFSHQTGQLEFFDLSFSDIKRVSFNQVDIPLLAGINIGRTVRIQAGPVMTYVLGASSDSGAGNVLDALVNDFDNKSWGYQAGAGLDLGRLALDVRYGGSLGKRTVDFAVDGTSYPVALGINSIQVTAGINIFK